MYNIMKLATNWSPQRNKDHRLEALKVNKKNEICGGEEGVSGGKNVFLLFGEGLLLKGITNSTIRTQQETANGKCAVCGSKAS